MTLNLDFVLNCVLRQHVWSSEAWLSKSYTCSECCWRTKTEKNTSGIARFPCGSTAFFVLVVWLLNYRSYNTDLLSLNANVVVGCAQLHNDLFAFCHVKTLNMSSFQQVNQRTIMICINLVFQSGHTQYTASCAETNNWFANLLTGVWCTDSKRIPCSVVWFCFTTPCYALSSVHFPSASP